MVSISGARHWTRTGTFEIVPVVLGGSWFFELRLNKNLLGTYAYPSTAAGSINAGEHDKEIGASCLDLDVPIDFRRWNGLG